MHALGELVRRREGGGVAERLRIEHRHIRERARNQRAAITDAEGARGQRGHAAHRLFDPADRLKPLLPARDDPHETRHRSVGARVRVVAAQRTPRRAQRGVAAGHDPRFAVEAPQIRFAHDEEERARARLIALDETADRAARRKAQLRRRVRHGTSAEPPHLFAPAAADHDGRPVARVRVEFILHTPARGGGTEGGEDRVASPGRGPVRQHHIQIRPGCGVRIAVAVERQPLVARAVERLQQCVELRPVVAAGGLQVRELHADPGVAREAQHLADRFRQPVPLAAHVRGVHPPAGRGRAGQRRDLLPFGVLARRVEQAGAQSPAALLQRLFEPPDHFAEILRRGRARGVSHDPRAQGVVTDELDCVDRRPHRIEQPAVFGDRAPGRPGFRIRLHPARGGEAGVALRRPVGGEARRAQPRRGRSAALAVDFRGDALREFARGVGFDQQIGVRMGVRVDESRRDHAARGLDLPRGPRGGEVADGRDAVTLHRDIRGPRRRAASVRHVSAAQDEIKGHAGGLIRFRAPVPPGHRFRVRAGCRARASR
jgi:hypothetical protein